jgi:uncharacterized protein YjbI with pentapeptide repeats
MKTYTVKELQDILDKHKIWLQDSTKGMCANLSGANLSRAYLSEANLSGANLSGAGLSEANLSEANFSGADLSEANLSRAYLSRANLSRANLSGADLSEANLSRAYLSRANLSRAYLSEANLSGADLSEANLSEANLSGANLSGANLSRANLSGADLSEANLSGANLSGAGLSDKDIPYILSFTQIVNDGTLTVWKKGSNNTIIELEIPKEAKRINCIGSRKCRAEFAKVKSITRQGKKLKEANGLYQPFFTYTVGKMVIPDLFDPSPLNECSHGVHFFLTRLEAERWNG